VDEAKIEAIKSWLIPTTLTQLQSFLGHVGFYRCFMRDFSTITALLNDLTKKGVSFRWGASQYQAFHTLIDKVTLAPLLQHLDFGKTLSSNVMQVELVLEVYYFKKVNPLLILVKN
jgi:hypothetical protein